MRSPIVKTAMATMSTTYATGTRRALAAIDGDALVAVRPDPASGERFLHGLRDRFRESGQDGYWLMWMITDESSGVSLIWMRSRPADPLWVAEKGKAPGLVSTSAGR